MKLKKVLITFSFVGIFLFLNSIPAYALELIVNDRKWVTNQPSSYYNDGKYTGSLTRYLHSGYYIPYDEKQVSTSRSGHGIRNYVCRLQSNGYYGFSQSWSGTDQQAPIPYNDGEYSGMMYRTGYTEISDNGPPSFSCDESTVGMSHRQEQHYIAYWSGKAVRPEVDTRVYRYQGWVEAVVSDPTHSVGAPGTSGGEAGGQFIWRLDKTSDLSPSQVELINSAYITGKHYATRNLYYSIDSSGVVSVTSSSPIITNVSNPNLLKDKNINYLFSYEYTNHYRNVYYCADSRSNGCYEWRFSHEEPDWNYVQNPSWSGSLLADHNYDETFHFDSDTSRSFVVGRTMDVGTNMNQTVQKEKFEVNASSITMPTQTWVEIAEQIKYESDFGNKLYVIDGDKYYYPNDIDDNLKDKYTNETSFDYSEYAIPLRIGEGNNTSVTFNTADNFYVTEKTGFQFSLPVDEISSLVIEDSAKKEYEEFTGQTYEDSVLTNPSEGSRYYFNINGNSEQEPNTWYGNDFVVGKLGLSDLTFHLNEDIQFEQYLIGNVKDEPLITQQHETVLNDISYDYSIQLSPEQIKDVKEVANSRNWLLHSFRSTDIHEKYNQLMNIIPSLSY